jgi:hypothetical protein
MTTTNQDRIIRTARTRVMLLIARATAENAQRISRG